MNAIDALLALKTHLETITTANGYPLTVCNVAMNRDALAIGSDAPLPMLTLFTQRDLFDQITDQGRGEIHVGRLNQSYRRIVELEGFVDVSTTGWEQALETLLTSVRLALFRYSHPLWMTAPVFLPPSQFTASFTITLIIKHTVDFNKIF